MGKIKDRAKVQIGAELLCKGGRQRQILGSQVSAVGSQVRVIRFGYGYGIWTCTCTWTP